MHTIVDETSWRNVKLHLGTNGDKKALAGLNEMMAPKIATLKNSLCKSVLRG